MRPTLTLSTLLTMTKYNSLGLDWTYTAQALLSISPSTTSGRVQFKANQTPIYLLGIICSRPSTCDHYEAKYNIMVNEIYSIDLKMMTGAIVSAKIESLNPWTLLRVRAFIGY